MQVIKPLDTETQPSTLSIFLGGSINKGTTINWQKEIEELLKDTDVTIYNPRRDDWDNSWKEDPTPGTKFYEQVQWELEHQDNLADWKIYVFMGEGMAPITLFEFGAFGTSDPENTMVFVDKKYPRYGNVVMSAEWCNVAWYDDWEQFKHILKFSVEEYLKTC